MLSWMPHPAFPWQELDGLQAVFSVTLFTILFLELGYLAFASFGVFRFWLRHQASECDGEKESLRVSCVITCYSEGRDVQRTILSLLEQSYSGFIEILAVVDGAQQNGETLGAAVAMQGQAAKYPKRSLRVLPKWLRGGRASSLNAGLSFAGGEVIMALDGDTSFDHDMVQRAVGRLQEPGVVALAGTLRVRNAKANLLTRLQALDYLLFRQYVRTGLGEFNVINNIPGAHGVFRIGFLRTVGGWDTGSAEDVDLALRIKKYFRQYPGLRVAADPHVISHTDVPDRWHDFFRQRLRWEGDPVYLHLRKHGPSLRPSIIGWKNFWFTLWYGVTFQILIPPAWLVSLLGILALSEVGTAVAIFLQIYFLYLCAALYAFTLDILLLSERPRSDSGLFPLLPLYPLFVVLVRLWSAFAVFHSLLLRSHLDTSMAPWWVLRKGKF
ncbi:MAG: glycosyltransferase family 2 protein [Pseudomonadota bacterium]